MAIATLFVLVPLAALRLIQRIYSQSLTTVVAAITIITVAIGAATIDFVL